MTKATTKAELQAQLAEMQESVGKLPGTKMLAVSSEHMLHWAMTGRRTDLNELDRFRDHVRRTMVRDLVEALIREGSVTFQEDLYDDHYRMGKSLRTTARLKIVA